MNLSARSVVTVAVAALAIACGGSSSSSGGSTGGAGNNGGGSGNTGGNGGGSNGGTGGGVGGGAACSSASSLPLPEDPGAPGPWAVGARTVTVAGLTTEVWYPAKPGSDAGKDKTRYDLRKALPDADGAKIPDADNPWQDCDCIRDLPIDDGHGPYPVVAFVHGTAGFRTQSLTFMTHWASRGFVVVSSDHPGIQLRDILGGAIGAGADQTGDTTKLLDALLAPSGDADFLAGHIDMQRVGLAGHSAGGGAIAKLGDRAQVIIPMAARGTSAGSKLVSTLVMGAQNDGIANFTSTKAGYVSSPAKKRLVGIANAGHLAFSDLCFVGRDKGGILQVALDHGVQVPQIVSTLAKDGCGKDQLPAEDGWKIVNHATSAALEETLTCSTTAAAALAAVKAMPNVSEYDEQQ